MAPQRMKKTWIEEEGLLCEWGQMHAAVVLEGCGQQEKGCSSVLSQLPLQHQVAANQ